MPASAWRAAGLVLAMDEAAVKEYREHHAAYDEIFEASSIALKPLLEAVEAVRAAAADLDRQIAEHHDDDDVPPPFSFRAATAAPKVLLPAVEVTGCTDCVGCNGVFVTSGRRNGLLPMAMRPPPLLPLGCRCCPTDRSVRA